MGDFAICTSRDPASDAGCHISLDHLPGLPIVLSCCASPNLDSIMLLVATSGMNPYLAESLAESLHP